MINQENGGRTIRIGIGAPLSGNASILGREMTQAIQIAIDEVNSDGGIAGTFIESRILDDKGSESEGLKVANAFASDEKLLAVIGHYNSDVTLCAAPIYQNAGLPMVAPIVSNPRLTDSGWTEIFRFTNRDDATAKAIVSHLFDRLQKRRAVIVETQTTYGSSMSQQFAKAFKAKGGEILAHHKVEEGEKDFFHPVEALPSSMDVVFYGGTFEGAPLLKAMRSKGLKQLFAAGDGCWDVTNFVEPSGKAAMEGEGVLVLSACPELGRVPGSLEFANRYQQKHGPILNYAVNSYDAAMAVLSAIRSAALLKGGGFNRSDVSNAMRQVKRQGIAYPNVVSWDTKGDNYAAVTALHKVKDGKFCQVDMRIREAAPPVQY
jgi:branched-chain amino acid transport system substrate-binding protein